MSLLQNGWARICQVLEFDYQSECHCSKTPTACPSGGVLFDYQSECHCSKTTSPSPSLRGRFDYQSECHCSKTLLCSRRGGIRLITSQNVTAPKHDVGLIVHAHRLITSQNVTAPKPLEQNLPCVEDELSGR